MNSATTPVFKVIHNYASANVGTTSWVALTKTNEDYANRLEIYDSGGKLMELGYGPSGSETSVAYIMPGGNGMIDIIVPKDTELSVRGVNGAATSGLLAINAYK